jgi:hypothetical protein
VLYRLLADLILLLHLAFVLFACAGAFAALRWPRVLWLQVPAAGWAAAIEFRRGICPLTPLENRLRRLGGEAGYGGGFIEHYLVPLLYPPGLTWDLQVVLGSLVVILNLGLYALVLARWHRAQREADS